MPSIARALAALAAFAVLSMPGLASAQTQDFPNKPVKLIVPYPAGGFPDVISRVVAQKLGERWGGNVLVENRPGANGNLGTASVAKAAPDGYTLLVGNSSTHGTNPSLYASIGYDPVQDFEPVVMLTQNTWFLGVPASLPVNTLAELVAYAKANPRKLNFGSFGLASGPHMAGEVFKQRAGIDIVHVPYKGTAMSLQALMANEIQMLFDSALITQHAKTGKIKLLATTSAQRWPGYPDLPTFTELGMSDLVINGWIAVFAPKGTPAPLVAKINADFNAVLALPELRQRFTEMTLTGVGGTPEALRERVQVELVRGREMVRLSGAKAE